MGDFADAQDYILLQFYLLALEDINDGVATPSEMASVVQKTYSKKIAEKAIQQLQATSRLADTNWSPPGATTEITTDGLTYVDQLLDRPEDTSFRKHYALKELHIEILREAFSASTEFPKVGKPVPAADRFVNAADNQPAIDELGSSVNELISCVEDDRSNDFPDKEGRLAELCALDLLLHRPQISVPLVESLIRDTVAVLAKQFAKATIGQIASGILKLAASIFGLKF